MNLYGSRECASGDLGRRQKAGDEQGKAEE